MLFFVLSQSVQFQDVKKDGTAYCTISNNMQIFYFLRDKNFVTIGTYSRINGSFSKIKTIK